MTDDRDDSMAALRALPAEERRAFCHRVVENLSDLVEGTADEELCREVERVLGQCRPYLAVRDTLEATIRGLRTLGGDAPTPEEDPGYSRCVDEVRRRLRDSRSDP